MTNVCIAERDRETATETETGRDELYFQQRAIGAMKTAVYSYSRSGLSIAAHGELGSGGRDKQPCKVKEHATGKKIQVDKRWSECCRKSTRPMNTNTKNNGFQLECTLNLTMFLTKKLTTVHKQRHENGNSSLLLFVTLPSLALYQSNLDYTTKSYIISLQLYGQRLLN